MVDLVHRDHIAENLGKRAPYYHLVPKDLAANLAFRQKTLTDAKDSESVRQDLWCMCRRDLLFWVAAFGWTLDPRLPAGFRKTPFIPYPFQEFMLLDLLDSIRDQSSRAIQKCRDMGLSWGIDYVVYHQWQFTEDFSAGLASRKYDLVVDSQNPDAVFSRLAFIKNNQPGWMVPNHTPYEGRWGNNDLGGALVGEPTTDNMFRAGRFTVVSLDEFASFDVGMDHKADKASANVTETRWFNSTPQGSANCFYQKCNPPKNDHFAPVHRRYRWTEHPEHVKGLYESKKGRVIIIDKSYPWPKDYPFVLDGKLRSAWYDKKCAELGWVKSKIAEELDGDFAGSGDPVFSHDELLEVVGKYTRPPLRTGMLMYDRETGKPGEFLDEINGPFRLWINLDAYGCVDTLSEFKVGVDVSKGTGYSNDAICVWNKQTHEKVAQYVDCVLGDYKLAELAVAVARLFNDAELCWELDGGFTFYKRVEDLKYVNFYFKRSKDESISGGKVTDTPGWKSTTQSKEKILKRYVHAMLRGRAFNRDESAIMECGRFKYAAGGGVIHENDERARAEKPSAAKHNHGDVVIADALAWFLIDTYSEQDRQEAASAEQREEYTMMNHPNPPRGSAAARWQEAMRMNRRAHLSPTMRQNEAVFCDA
jgi:hypothetical protein